MVFMGRWLDPARVVLRGSRGWTGAVTTTLLLGGLVAAAAGAGWVSSVTSLALSAIGFTFFYLLFADSLHFGLTIANFVTIYACGYEVMWQSNFPDASRVSGLIGLAMPATTLLGASLAQRRYIGSILRIRRRYELAELPRLSPWLPCVAVLASLSFGAPHLGLDSREQSALLLVLMGSISLVVAISVRGVVLLMMDIAIVFGTISERLDRLVMPVMAFFTAYLLSAAVFACLYRISQQVLGDRLFLHQGRPIMLNFADALYFSISTMATVGYGDIVPAAASVRVLAMVEVLWGQFLLLFGFSEIMRGGGPDTIERQRLREHCWSRARERGPSSGD